jgi:threonyl-tRNA synthetase
VEGEVTRYLEMLRHVYDRILKFEDYRMSLSTRPEKKKRLGKDEDWDHAEGSLRRALEATGKPWGIKEGDGAFYGPKIDIEVKDAVGRWHQLGTLQLDFQLPQRFGLRYAARKTGVANPAAADESIDAGGNSDLRTPVLIHRAILGSLERAMALLIEHYGGRWPFWLSPRQIRFLSVEPSYDPYVKDVMARLRKQRRHWHIEADFADHSTKDAGGAMGGETLNKRVRNAEVDQVNFVLVVGARELKNDTVRVRTRNGKDLGERTIDQVIEMLDKMEQEFE